MKILITGSNGFIFSNFIRKIFHERKDLFIVGVDKIIYPYLLNTTFAGTKFNLHIGDIADTHFIDTIFKLERPDIVINGAVSNCMDEIISNPTECINTNIFGAQVLANASLKYGVKKFLQISTDEVTCSVADENAPRVKEDALYNAKNPFTASKAAAELMIKAMGTTHGLPYSIARCSTNYGPRQTPNKFVPKIIQSIINDQKIPVFGQGKQMRDWCHVFETCAALFKVMDDGLNGEIYNIASNQEFSNIELVNEICNLMGKGHNLIEFVADRKDHEFRFAVDNSKIKALGWKPYYKLRDGLEQCVNWYQVNKYILAK